MNILLNKESKLPASQIFNISSVYAAVNEISLRNIIESYFVLKESSCSRTLIKNKFIKHQTKFKMFLIYAGSKCALDKPTCSNIPLRIRNELECLTFNVINEPFFHVSKVTLNSLFRLITKFNDSQ